MMNIAKLMKQAQEMQGKMQEMQDKLKEQEVTGVSGGGLVSVTLDGKGEGKAVKIDPSLLKEGDAEMVEDLVLAALNDAKAKVEKLSSEQMGELTGGLPLPKGFKFPF